MIWSVSQVYFWKNTRIGVIVVQPSHIQDWPEKFAACEVQISAGSSVDLDAEQLPEPWNTLQFLEEKLSLYLFPD